jgi:hypothetical protein
MTSPARSWSKQFIGAPLRFIEFIAAELRFINSEAIHLKQRNAKHKKTSFRGRFFVPFLAYVKKKL